MATERVGLGREGPAGGRVMAKVNRKVKKPSPAVIDRAVSDAVGNAARPSFFRDSAPDPEEADWIREGLLGDSDEVELRRDVAGLKERAQPAEGLRGAVERMEAELTKLERRSAALDERVRSRGEDIPERRDRLLANLAKVGGGLEGLESYGAFGPEARARIERESDELRGLVGEKRRERHSLEGAISHAERQAAGLPAQPRSLPHWSRLQL